MTGYVVTARRYRVTVVTSQAAVTRPSLPRRYRLHRYRVGRVGRVKLLVTPHEAAPATMARPRRQSSGELGDNSIELLNCWLIRMTDNGVLLLVMH